MIRIERGGNMKTETGENGAWREGERHAIFWVCGCMRAHTH